MRGLFDAETSENALNNFTLLFEIRTGFQFRPVSENIILQ